MTRRKLIIYLLTLLCCISLCRQHAFAQDSITYSSTCSNYKIAFSSSLFSRVAFPDKVKWDFGDPASGFYNFAGVTYPTHSFSSPGTYAITLTVSSAGVTTVVTGSINVVDPLTYNFGPDVYLCKGSSTTLAAPAISGAKFLWNDEDSTITDTLHVDKTGVYTVAINGCAVKDSVGVYVSDQPKVDLGDDHVLCAGEVLTLDAANQNAIYTWKLNGAVIPGLSVAQAPVMAPGGEYIAEVNVPGCGIFSDTVNVTFSSTPAPPFSLGPDTLLCPKQIFPITANVAGGTSYKWSTKETTQSISVTRGATYWAFVNIGGQCEVVDSIIVKYRGDKNLEFHDTAICQGTTLILDANFGNGTYNWTSDPPQRNDQNQTGQSTYYVYAPGKYKITAAVGSCAYTDSLTVSFNDSIVLDIGKDTLLCDGEPFMLQIKGNANTYTWQDGSTALTYAVQSAGRYTVIGVNGCGSDTASVKIDMHSCACELHLPNAFTPNGDGLNDNFRPLHPCNIGKFMMRIFNRYGEPVFESADLSTAWTGTYKGKKAEAGTYVWMASYFDTSTKQTLLKKGTVTLIR